MPIANNTQTTDSTRNRVRTDDPIASPAAATDNQFLAFRLGGEEYGLPILSVQEIRGWKPPTQIANAPDFIKGVVNLRGTIVPIVDMRIKFNIDHPAYDQNTVVIVLNVGQRVVGMVVDGVTDVITLTLEQIHAAPEMPSTALNSVTGLGIVGERMLILVDIEKLLMSDDMGLFDRLDS